jgi:hypothetical protein
MYLVVLLTKKNTYILFIGLEIRPQTALINPLPHGVLASFCLTAGGLLRPPEEDDISKEKTILMT